MGGRRAVCRGEGTTKRTLENVAIASALQLEAARATPALCRFNYDAKNFDVAEPIHCRIIAFLLLIHYFTITM